MKLLPSRASVSALRTRATVSALRTRATVSALRTRATVSALRTRATVSALRIAALDRLRYRADVLGSAAFVVLLLFVFSRLWQHVAVEGRVGRFSVPELLLHLLLAEVIMVAPGFIGETLGREVRSGDLGTQLLRPVNWVTFELARALGATLVRAGLVLLTGLPVIALLVGLPEVRAANVAWAALTLLVALVVECTGRLLIGILAFWMEDATPFGWLWQKAGLILGGVLLPLPLCPEWFQVLARVLPFGAILSGPTSALYAESPVAAAVPLVLLGAWGAGFIALLHVVHARPTFRTSRRRIG